jgi:hypothetical protein
MWDVLSKDYDLNLKSEDCAFNVIRNSSAGSIVVFHDSEKAFPRMQHSLINTLQFFLKGWRFASMDEQKENSREALKVYGENLGL